MSILASAEDFHFVVSLVPSQHPDLLAIPHRKLRTLSSERLEGVEVAWRKEKMDWLKHNRWNDVLEALRPSLEPAHLPDPEAPVRACFRYLSNHSDFLDYTKRLGCRLTHRFGRH